MRYLVGLANSWISACTMNAPTEMVPDEVLEVTLRELRREHRDLDGEIRTIEQRGTGDALTLRRLKKQKLLLRDRIAALEDRLTPDIIA